MKIISDSTPFEDTFLKVYYANNGSRYYTQPVEGTVELCYNYFNEKNAWEEFFTCSLFAYGLFHAEHYDKRVNQREFGIELILDGAMYVQAGRMLVLAEAGDLVIMTPHTDYEFRPQGNALRKLGLMLTGKLLDTLVLNTGLNRFQVFPLVGSEEFFASCKPLLQAMAHPDRSRNAQRRISGAAFSLLTTLATMRSREKSAPLLDRIRNYMEQNLATPNLLTLTRREFGLSAFQLRKLFCSAQMATPNEYLAERRSERATQFLIQKHHTIKEIATFLGYENSGNFSTAFRKRYGCSPRHFRDTHSTD